jgi:hypothetical protein
MGADSPMGPDSPAMLSVSVSVSMSMPTWVWLWVVSLMPSATQSVARWSAAEEVVARSRA